MKLRREFHFDAAHQLDHYADGHPNRRIHGHSFRVRVSLNGIPDKSTGQIMDLDQLKAALDGIRGILDHNMLNDIEDLGPPTLENLTIWIWDKLIVSLPMLSEVEIFRDSLGQSCCYEGPNNG
ncbi:6-carboxytetrahydropterin synthase [Alphaproteobacteria bacterium]|jgi:6-pyruvoyltetrahydropterin/6-carboxytetrahydropterin synthase|nr:6-carboxytetrahydropterin synthase [Alphaproteobacteria bacterium]